MLIFFFHFFFIFWGSDPKFGVIQGRQGYRNHVFFLRPRLFFQHILWKNSQYTIFPDSLEQQPRPFTKNVISGFCQGGNQLINTIFQKIQSYSNFCIYFGHARSHDQPMSMNVLLIHDRTKLEFSGLDSCPIFMKRCSVVRFTTVENFALKYGQIEYI